MSLAILVHGFLHKLIFSTKNKMTIQSVHSLLEQDALDNSSAVFAYSTTASAPFGTGLESAEGKAEVYQMETRAGAGAALVGYVDRVAHTSAGAASQKAVAVLASTDSFVALAPSLLALPASNVRAPINVHVSAQTSSSVQDADGHPTLVQVPALGQLFEGVAQLTGAGWEGAVVLSENAAQAASVGTGLAKSLNAAGFDLVNVFDGLTTGRQLTALEPTSAAKPSGQSLESLLATVPYFEYSGSATATQVVVLPASTYSAAAKAAIAAAGLADVGLLTVRVLKPWDATAFLAAIPESVKVAHLFAQDEQSPFYDEVLSSLVGASRKLKLRSLAVPSATVPTVADFSSLIATATGAKPTSLKSLLHNESKLAVFWDLDATVGKTETVPAALAAAFASGASGVAPTLETKYDNFRQGGVQQSTLLLAPTGAQKREYTLATTAETAPASLLFVASPAAVFKAYEVLSTESVSAETAVVIASNWTKEDLTTKVPLKQLQSLAKVAGGKRNLFLIDADAVAAELDIRSADVAEIVFWQHFLPSTIGAKEIAALLAATPTFAKWDQKKIAEASKVVKGLVNQVEIDSAWATIPADAELPADLPTKIVATAAGPNPDRTFAEPISAIVGKQAQSWHQPAQRLLFPEAFAASDKYEDKLRPDLPEKNFLITVSENRRLTPNTYDRNVFHIEFSTEGTGLTYAIGEALGIHGHNDTEEVLDFLAWYGLDPDAVVSVPAREDPSRIEQRTVFQLFQQNLDLFGKPGKSFYETLSKYATNKNEERALRFIACPDGASTFKKMSETETVTYADLLRQFPSAKPSLEDLVREIEEIKPRHYSIASSQNFVGDSVHLLIVTVEWNTPKGSPRFGQCTRYLAGLKVGDKVMASVKPSVMKLPAVDTNPIVMAGLGTGAAPFRAFIQERAYQKAQGKEIGPVLYYFGSRHRSKEYLYGEEIEAYLQEGIVTHTGLAFSRDTDKKVYIQHKIQEDSKMLVEMMRKGTFYLCGPTWPVPDLTAAFIEAFVKDGKTVEQATAHIEELKENDQWILEVY